MLWVPPSVPPPGPDAQGVHFYFGRADRWGQINLTTRRDKLMHREPPEGPPCARAALEVGVSWPMRWAFVLMHCGGRLQTPGLSLEEEDKEEEEEGRGVGG